MSSNLDLPSFDAQNILVVSIRRPTDQNVQDELERVVASALHDSKPDATSKIEFVHCADTARQAQLERECADGSNAVLFETALQAHTKGWDRLAVADSLTYRQLQGDLRPQEKSGVSLIILQITAPDETSRNGSEEHSGVLAKRFTLPTAVGVLFHDGIFGITPFAEQNDRWMENRIFDEYGMAIHDPERSLFQRDLVDDWMREDYGRTVQRALSLRPSLPIEVVDMIEEVLNEEVSLQELTNAPELLNLDMNVLEFHALVPISECCDVTDELKQAVKTHNSDTQAIVYPWKGKLPATRRQFWRLWSRIVDQNRRPFYMAAAFIDTAAAAQDDTVIIALWHYNNPAIIVRVGINFAVRIWQSWHHGQNTRRGELDLAHEPLKDVELLYSPEARFFDDPPLWRDIGGSSRPPVFFLTRKPDEEALRQLEDEMNSQLGRDSDPAWYVDKGGAYSFLDWKRDEDGTERDMIEIALECSRYWGGRLGQRYIIFVDRESLASKQVLLSCYERHRDDDYESNEPDSVPRDLDISTYHEGIKVVRTPISELYSQWVNLDIANSSWFDFFQTDDAGNHYEREIASDDEKRRAMDQYVRYRY